MKETPKGKMLRGAGRVAFLARIETIRELVDAGYSLLSIYQHFDGELGISYTQFTRYVTKYIQSPMPETKTEVPAVEAPPPPDQPETKTAPKPKPKPKSTGFNFSATSGADRDDLI